MLLWRSLFVVVLLLASCAEDELVLLVELKTDLVPGVEFAAVRTSLEDAAVSDEVAALEGEGYFDGARVASFEGLSAGERLVVVRLLGVDGSLVTERRVRVTQDSDFGVTVVVTRDCRGVVCSDPAASQCYGGRCVPDDCVDGGPECGVPECESVADCDPGAACAAAECNGGNCEYRSDATMCPESEYCDPDRGCAPLPGTVPTMACLDAAGPIVSHSFALATEGPTGVRELRDVSIRPPRIRVDLAGTGSITLDGGVGSFDGNTFLASSTFDGQLVYDAIIAAGALSFEVWFRPAPEGFTGALGGLVGGMWIQQQGTPVRLSFVVGRTGVLSDVLPSLGTLHHVVGTFEPGSHGIWVDGVDQSSGLGADDFSAWDRTFASYKIGSGSTSDFRGGVARIALYDRVLLADEIACLAAAGADALPE